MKKTDLPKYRELVSLIPGGTLQFLDLGFNTAALPKLETEYWEWEERAEQEGLPSCWQLMCLRPDDLLGAYVNLHTGSEAVEPGIAGKRVVPGYSLNAERALEPFLDQWVPLPFFRKESLGRTHQAHFQQGPADWVRIMIRRDPNSAEKGPLLATLVFDTSIDADAEDEKRDDDPYPALRLRDVRDGAEFTLAYEVKHTTWFIAQEWVSAWLEDLFEQLLVKKNRGRPVDPSTRDTRVEHLARYISFLEVLHKSGVIPAVRLVDPSRNDAINVDLVLDIGNSRTAGMLIERRDDDAMALGNSVVLELRDLSRPGLKHREPFGSNVAFVRQRFGDPNGFARGSGRLQKGFMWPSVVRIGPEASHMALRSRRDEGQTTMSSPKRYLWDTAARPQEWRYCPDADDGHADEPPVNSGVFLGFINNRGTPLHALDDPRVRRDPSFRDQDPYPATEPMFSRSSLMMFLLSEILTQALAQINAPHQRGARLNPDLARRLRQIILTVPAAMTVVERRIFERWANWSVETLWKTLEWDMPGPARFAYQAPPIIRCQWDEASTTQMVYVYNEVAEKFAGDASTYFGAHGRLRAERGSRASLRVASIDIGGGTTDMIVTTYLDNSHGATAMLEPKQEFREGFNLAGDDILKAVIERHLLDPLAAALEQRGFAQAKDLLTRQVGKDITGMSQQHKTFRAQFSQQYAVPVGLYLMSLSEAVALPDTVGCKRLIRFADVFEQVERPRADVMAWMNDELTHAAGLVLEDWEWSVDLSEVAATIEACVSPVLGDLCEAVAAWDCDILLLSGRPSCLPAVQAAVFRRPPLPVGRIIPMSQYRVENWYPFWSPGGLIADPKTTGVVGAMLCALSESDLPNFHCNTSQLQPASTVRYVGAMNATGQIKNEHLFFQGIDLDANGAEPQQATFPYGAPIFIGFRQLPLERWKATPLYQLSLASQQAKDEARKHPFPWELKLVYQRTSVNAGSGGEVNELFDEGIFKIEEITSVDGSNIRPAHLLMELKTIRDESGYWLDTGLFDVH